MSLKQYQEKRKFDQTPEPDSGGENRNGDQPQAGGDGKDASDPQAGEQNKSASEPIFVIQKHYASHLHWDFRLEAEGVLKSWAVPKGPSMNPADKRLAVQVEDHPLDYANFEGTIPEGNYGAGTVEIWDSGTFTYIEKFRDLPDAIEHGILEFKLHGRILKGLFTLVRTNMDKQPKNWLLMKKDDQYAVHTPYDAADVPSGGQKEATDKSSQEPKEAAPAPSGHPKEAQPAE